MMEKLGEARRCLLVPMVEAEGPAALDRVFREQWEARDLLTKPLGPAKLPKGLPASGVLQLPEPS